MDKALPLYEFIFDESKLEGLTAIAIVDQPAILVDFLKFNNEEPLQFKVSDKVKRELVGPIMIPGMRIYRRDSNGEEYYGYFSADTCEKMHEEFMRKGLLTSFNLMHDGVKIEGAFIKETWLTGNQDKASELGFILPPRTPMANVKCSEELWEIINQKGLKGFSIECFADVVQVFGKQCSLTRNDITLATIRKAIADVELEQVQLSKEFSFEYWNKKCSCAQCKELKSWGYCLPGVLPDGEFISKKSLGFK